MRVINLLCWISKGNSWIFPPLLRFQCGKKTSRMFMSSRDAAAFFFPVMNSRRREGCSKRNQSVKISLRDSFNFFECRVDERISPSEADVNNEIIKLRKKWLAVSEMIWDERWAHTKDSRWSEPVSQVKKWNVNFFYLCLHSWLPFDHSTSFYRCSRLIHPRKHWTSHWVKLTKHF